MGIQSEGWVNSAFAERRDPHGAEALANIGGCRAMDAIPELPA